MRVATAGIGLLLLTTSAYAQALPCAPLADAYDSYNPSHLAIVRQYGGTVIAHAPISTLLKLDPYVPSQAELLRQLGSGIPLWPMFPFYSYAPLPAPLPGVVSDCGPVPEPSSASAAPITRFADLLTALQRERATGATAAVAPAARGAQAERNKGVLIYYEGRAWVSAGAAVPFSDAEFVRVGESAGLPVFRRTGAKDDLIFVTTTPQMVAPFQAIR